MSLRRFALLAALLASSAAADEVLRVDGSSALVAPFVSATTLLRQLEIELRVNSESNTPRAIAAVGEDEADLALSTRPVLPSEHANYPDRPLAETVIGYQALAFIVSQDVWDAGVRSLSKAEMQRIYEGQINNWKQLKGPDRAIKFFNPEKGKGAWEFFVTWLYGEVQKAPLTGNFETVANAEETRNLIEFNGGSLSVIPSNRAESSGTHALQVRREDGTLIAPTPANIRARTYPITRPVIVVTAFRPAGPFRKALDFMRSVQGQGLVRKADIISVQEEEAE